MLNVANLRKSALTSTVTVRYAGYTVKNIKGVLPVCETEQAQKEAIVALVRAQDDNLDSQGKVKFDAANGYTENLSHKPMTLADYVAAAYGISTTEKKGEKKGKKGKAELPMPTENADGQLVTTVN